MTASDGVALNSFHGARGGSEHLLTVTAPPAGTLAEQIAAVADRYAGARRALRLDPETAVFRRVFVSDAQNQSAAIAASALAGGPEEGPVAVSVVQQPPLNRARLSLMAYHVEDPVLISKRRLSDRHVLIRKNGRRHLWSTGMCAGAADRPSSTAAQTRGVFADLIGALAAQQGNLAAHCQRTWLYIKDVDVFYEDMVAARSALFAEHGLTGQTHFIASTGIEGACADRYDVVAMDAYSALDLQPGQVTYLNDFDRLCATKDYNVTFERATRIDYADRSQFLISGTASIDAAGRIVHPGNVEAQLDRAVENIEGLLRAGGADLTALTHLLVYLRDPADAGRIGAALRGRFPGLPMLLVQGAVCRPGWLVELEGTAIAPADRPDLPCF